MAPKYELVYFDGRGRAEVMRFLFVVNGTEFTDKRVTSEQWKASEKAKAPLGTLPYLKITDGKPPVLAESIPITRYLAKEFKLAGKNKEDEVYVDMIVCLIGDSINKAADAFAEKDADLKAKKLSMVMTETLPEVLSKLNTIVERHGKEKFAVDNKMTVADLMILSLVENFDLDKKDPKDKAALSNFTKVKEVVEKTRTNDKIAAWLKKRPVTSF